MNVNFDSRITRALFGLMAFVATESSRADFFYVNDYFGNRIDKYDLATGNFLGTFANSGMGGPNAMAFDSAGNLFVSGYSGNFITKYAPNGTYSTFGTGLLGPSGLAFDKAGNLYVANFYQNNIVKYSPGGVEKVFANTGLDHPMGLAFDSAGNLYAANYQGQTIEKFSPDGVPSVFASSGLNYPWGLAFDKAGNLFVANFWGNNIEKFTPGGVGSVFATVSSSTSSLRYLAFDDAGNLYATDYDNSTVIKFAPNGAASLLANVGRNGGIMDNPVGIVIQVIPEPAPFALLGLGILLLLVRKTSISFRIVSRIRVASRVP